MSIAAMDVPKGLAWELVVVDNGSKDRTADVIESFTSELPIRRVLEPEAGLSHARNRGVSEARGDYLVWTDDDVIVHRDWLAAYVAAFRRYPKAAFFGGPIHPLLEPPTPSWFRENLDILAYLTVTRDLGENELAFSLEGDRIPYGANYAVRAAEQRQVPYDVCLGRSPKFGRGGEEIAVLRALLRSGAGGWWVPEAIVTHVLSAQRQSRASVLDYFKSSGQTSAYLSDIGADNFMGTTARFPWIYVKAAVHLSLALVARPFSSRVWLRHTAGYGHYRGAIDYWTAKRRLK
jgi:hypothetical protein